MSNLLVGALDVRSARSEFWKDGRTVGFGRSKFPYTRRSKTNVNVPFVVSLMFAGVHIDSPWIQMKKDLGGGFTAID